MAPLDETGLPAISCVAPHRRLVVGAGSVKAHSAAELGLCATPDEAASLYHLWLTSKSDWLAQSKRRWAARAVAAERPAQSPTLHSLLAAGALHPAPACLFYACDGTAFAAGLEGDGTVVEEGAVHRHATLSGWTRACRGRRPIAPGVGGAPAAGRRDESGGGGAGLLRAVRHGSPAGPSLEALWRATQAKDPLVRWATDQGGG